MASDSDDEDAFVTLGTPVDVPDTDEPRKKPVSFKELPVTDNKGRVRFHGAFTGGYSAGYFNSVGSQEGWAPSTFISSRNDRSKPSSSQRPEDFMDDEDLGEHGIAPRKYVTSSSFASEERRKRRHDEANLATAESTLLGSSALLNLIVPERITIGVKLLRKMGWKEGQGIGPRMKRKPRKMPATTKVYGCEPPPSDSDDDDDGIDDESLLKDITFAPKDSAHILMNVKDNTKGLGYRGLDPRKALPSSHINLFSQSVGSKLGLKGIRGQAFGVGALEEEDDDIYGADDKSNYDMTMTAEDENETFGWTGSKNKGQMSTPVGYVGKLLEGFKLSSSKLVQKKEFPPPRLPSTFRPMHTFRKIEEAHTLSMTGGSGVDYRQFMKPQDLSDSVEPSTSTEMPQQSSQRKQTTDSLTRSLALGEQPFVGSVFDLIPEKDKKKMEKVKAGESMETEDVASDLPPDNKTKDTEQTDVPKDTTTSGPETVRTSAPLYQGGGFGVRPFAADSAKQERYEKYLSFMKQGQKDPYSMITVSGRTEWEIEREREEFAHAARLFKPLAGMLAMRFSSAGVEDNLVSVKKEEKLDLSEPAKAAEMKMYGKLTRDVVEWHPDKLVCKRFNVPDPYPQSNIVGLAGLKRDKYSVFNFLTFSNPTEADRNQSKRDEDIENQQKEKDEKSDSCNRNDVQEKQTEKTLKPTKAGTVGFKSIFTHLVGGTSHLKNDSGASQTGLSFNIKSKDSQKSKVSVFDDGESKSVEGLSTKKNLPIAEVFDLDEKAKLGNTKAGESNKPDIDLFRAIFKNTDSESSSDEEESSILESEDGKLHSKGSTNNQLDEETMIASGETKEQISDVHNEDLPVNVPSTEVSVLPGSGESIPSLQERLSPDVGSDDSDTYGPALPPPSSTNTEGSTRNRETSAGEIFVDLTDKSSMNSGKADRAIYVDLTDKPSMDSGKSDGAIYVDLTKGSSRKHKHKHKERHKSKKDKKAKYKKSKHKKKRRKSEKKEKKSKEREKSDIGSDTTDKDTDSDTDVPSDKVLLDKMKMLKPGQRMRAADFL